MKDLPSGWQKVNLGAIIECLDNERVPLNSEQRSKMQGDIPYFGANGQLDAINQFIFDEELLLLAEDGGSWGKKEKCTYIIRGKSWVNNHAHVLRMKKSINITYLMHFLNFSDLNKYITGSTRGKLNRKSMEKIEVTLPPLPTQKKIATILEKAERLKEWRKEADRLTDEFLKSTFLEMFGDPVKNPMGWEKKKLKEFGEVKTGNTPSRKKPEYYGNYIEWIKSDNINTPNTYLTKSDEMLSELGVKIGRTAPKGSVLVTCIAGSLSCIGNVAIADRNVAFNQQINTIIPNNKTNELFIYHLILNSKSYIQNYSTKSMKGMVSKSLFESLPFIFPPIDLQNKFGAIAKDFESLKNYQSQSKQQIDDLFNALMQKAFKGELAC